MADREPTNAEILASAIGILLAARDLTQRADRTSYRDTCETLDALGEGAAVAGGSLLHLAERLGLQAEVDRMVKQGQGRIAKMRACQGQWGRA